MRRKLSLLLVVALLFGILAGCQPEDSTKQTETQEQTESQELTEAQELRIKQEYLDLTEDSKYYGNTVDDLSVYVVYSHDGIYALYVDCKGMMYADALTTIYLEKQSADGTSSGAYQFDFPSSQLLWIYTDNDGLCTLMDAWYSGILTDAYVETLLKDTLFWGLGRIVTDGA